MPTAWLRIAAKVDVVDHDYWCERIEPLVRAHANVQFIGEIGDAEKAAFLGNASALLFPHRLVRAVRPGHD